MLVTLVCLLRTGLAHENGDLRGLEIKDKPARENEEEEMKVIAHLEVDGSVIDFYSVAK